MRQLRLGLIGDPVAHSRSTHMMKAAFKEMGLADLASYEVLAVSKEHLFQQLQEEPIGKWDGFNVTIPHKIDVIKLLDELDDSAKTIGAVNTVIVRDGKRIGYNTDGIGYLRSLMQETDLLLAEQSVVIVGAGGAARAVGTVLAKQGVRKIQIMNRTTSRGEELANHLRQWTNAEACSFHDGMAVIRQATILIQTTSVGMHPLVEEMPIPEEWLFPGLMVSDLIYNPRDTALLKVARQKGCKIHHGLGMLVHQAAYALELWTGREAPVEVMRRALEESLMNKG